MKKQNILAQMVVGCLSYECIEKGSSSHQLHRSQSFTHKTAWFMTHRIKEAMKDPVFTRQLGGAGKTVEADETFWGNQKRRKGTPGRGYAYKEKIFSLIERVGDECSFHVPAVTAATRGPIMQEQIRQDTQVFTDDFGSFSGVDDEFLNHQVVNHRQKEYTRGPIHATTVKNYVSILKSGLVGVYQHVGAHHLKRCIGEFDFGFNSRNGSDGERAQLALKGIDGRRLLYRDS
ncbi:MAG: IS1595 family transposase [candidate division Zixibacteria bacterium]|nr:IS1595 family transposase [candidate division Zixibacteria bacterium]MBU1470650.1 IS1595 family transposase [candidate division Zixibacteria bacterium]MBU2624129.1 IS1595 family transposase [candidate division Zixibacteria bacterium]